MTKPISYLLSSNLNETGIEEKQRKNIYYCYTTGKRSWTSLIVPVKASQPTLILLENDNQATLILLVTVNQHTLKDKSWQMHSGYPGLL